MIIREIGASLRALFSRLSSKTTTIAGTETVYLDDAGTSVKATLSDAMRYGGGNSTRITTIGNANIHQSNTGQLWLEVTGQTAGNARGAGAFDWQATRTNAGQVASGVGAIAIGATSRSSGNNTIAFGANANATANSAVAIGSTVTASGTGAYCLGANSNASGGYATVVGFSTAAANAGQFAFGYSPQNGGVNQGTLQTLYSATTDANSTQLNISGTATDRVVIPATRSVAFIGIVQAMCNVSSSSNFIKAWKIEGVIARDGSNNTRIVGTPTITVMAQDADGTQTPSTWAIASITADDTNEALAINVTGQTGQTIRWQATLLYSQVGF